MDAIEYLSIETLKPNPNNARTHSKKQVRQIAQSITAFGFVNPVLIEEAGTVIAGHGRLAAARLLKLSEVPCRRITHMNAAEKRAYALADNKLALNAGWNTVVVKVINNRGDWFLRCLVADPRRNLVFSDTPSKNSGESSTARLPRL